MDFQLAKAPTESDMFGFRTMLIPEKNDFTFQQEAINVANFLVSRVAHVDAVNNGANGGTEVLQGQMRKLLYRSDPQRLFE